MASSRASRRPSAVLLVVLLVALAAGAAASLLIGAATSSGPSPLPTSEWVVPPSLLEGLVFGLIALLVGALIYQRIAGGTAPVPRRLIVTALVTILLALLFLAILRSVAGGGPLPSGGVPTPVQPGVPPPPPSGGNSSVTGGNFTPIVFPGLPSWLPFALIVGVLVIVVAAALPLAQAYWTERSAGPRRPAPDAKEVEGARAVLHAAEQELAEGGDPREIIRRLYSGLLARLGPMVGSVEIATPEEIRTRHLLRLGVRPTAALALTRLFEEARYSSHPLGDEAVRHLRGAVSEALLDLDREAPT